MTSYGIAFMEPAGTRAISKSSLPAYAINGLFRRPWDRAVIVPTSVSQLFYIGLSEAGDRAEELAPAGTAGFSDESPSLPDGYRLCIVLVFAHYYENGRRIPYIYQHLPQPLKLKISSLNPDGSHDPANTTELYAAIWADMHRTVQDESYADYGSRPIYW
jgi:hypothetical protein